MTAINMKACLLFVLALYNLCCWHTASSLRSFGRTLLKNDETLTSPKLAAEIRSYADAAEQIISYSLNGPGQNQSYERLASFVDTFGGRMSGSQNLEHSIDYMLSALEREGFDNVHGEEVNAHHWERNTEHAKLLSPREYDISILGLGTSIGTPSEGITADVIVVRSFEELDERRQEIPGKIVVYNQPYISYGASAEYRVVGASRASAYGALAALVRSVTPFSINSPHTGAQFYEEGAVEIPVAGITIEDAEMLDRMEKRGDQITVFLYMGCKTHPMTTSRNTVAELKGTTYPEQVVVVSGHLDSWDVGQGAMDDGGGAFISWQALSTIRALGLTTKRTLRLVMWTDEEFRGNGAEQYYNRHKKDADNYSILFEADEGVFTPYGIKFTG